jgi:hypothetical protein
MRKAYKIITMLGLTISTDPFHYRGRAALRNLLDFFLKIGKFLLCEAHGILLVGGVPRRNQFFVNLS